MSKGSRRRPEDSSAIARNWPFPERELKLWSPPAQPSEPAPAPVPPETAAPPDADNPGVSKRREGTGL